MLTMTLLRCNNCTHDPSSEDAPLSIPTSMFRYGPRPSTARGGGVVVAGSPLLLRFCPNPVQLRELKEKA